MPNDILMLQTISTITTQIMNIAEVIFFWRYVCCIFVEKHNKYVSLLIMIVGKIFLSFLLSILKIQTYAYLISNVLNVLLLFVCILFLWEAKWAKALSYTLVGSFVSIYAHLSTSFLATQFIAMTFFSSSNAYGLNVIQQILLQTGFHLMVTFLLTISCKHDKKRMALSFATVLINLTLINLYLNAIAYYPKEHWRANLFLFLLLGFNIVMFLIGHFYKAKKHESDELESQLQRETAFVEYYQNLLEQQENQGILIHDLKKHLNSIDILVKQGKIQEAEKYIQQILSSAELKDNLRICDNPFLNAILARYARICDSSHIELRSDIRSGCLDFMKERDLTALICNLMDNAVETAQRQDNGFVELNINIREKTPFTVLTIHNSCRTNPFSSDGKTLPSTKPQKNGHGYGLKSIQRIVQLYNGEIQMYYDDNTLTFHTIITLKNQDVH